MPTLPTLHPIIVQMQPSDEQLPAILARGKDVIVSAGAGSGKTRTLTARILALVAEGVPLRAIVAVTFTIKAASEMRNRLRAEIQRYLASSGLDPAERSFWRDVAAEIDSARIGTIHSLCSEILRFNAAEAGVDPLFSVFDESQAALRKYIAIEDGLAFATATDSVGAQTESFGALTEALSPDALRKTLALLLADRMRAERALDPANEARIAITLEVWSERVAALLANAENQEAIAELRKGLLEVESSERAASDALAQLLQPSLDAWEGGNTALAEQRPLDALQELAYFGGLPRNKGRRDAFRTGNPKAALLQLLTSWREQVALPEGTDPRADLLLLTLLPTLRVLYAHSAARYAAEKQRARALDFDDLESYAYALLTGNEAVRSEWQTQVQALLIDEFQDTNTRQRDLLRAIAGGCGILFMVGDAKQSIYRFRGGDVRVFRRERSAVAADAGLAVNLARSFRAHPALLDRLNLLLADPESAAESAPQPDYVEPFAPLVSGDELRQPRTPAPWIEVQLGVGAKNVGALVTAADALALRLHELHNEGFGWDEMAILSRRAKAFVDYEDAFERHAIPYVTTAGAGFHLRPEVRDFLNLLRAIADPNDNLAMAGLLRSPVIGFSDADLLALRHTITPPESREPAQPGAWWHALKQQSSANARYAIALINDLHALAGRVPVHTLIAMLLERTHYEATLLPAGNQRAARNLAKLLEDAQTTPEGSVRAFLATIDELASSGARTGEARSESSGSVQIMTIHAAKGLEFPVVVLGDAGGRGGSGGSDALFDDDLGLLLPLGYAGGGKSLLYAAAAERDKRMDEAEAGRLLYVAATRTRERLILSGTVKINERGELQLDGWLKRLAPALGLDAPLPIDVAATLNTGGDDGVRTFALASDAMCVLHWRAPLRAELPSTASLTEAPTKAADPRPFQPILLEPTPYALRPETVPLKTAPERPADESIDRTLAALTTLLESVRTQRASALAPRPKSLTAPAWLIGDLVHGALEVQLQPHDERFSPWLDAQFDNHADLDSAQRRDAYNRVTALLRRYFASPLHAEVLAARTVLREVPFAALLEVTQTDIAAPSAPLQSTLFADATQATSSHAAPSDPTMGRIDLLYQRGDGEWALVEFKIDRISGRTDTRQHLARRAGYYAQVRRYGSALYATTQIRANLRLCLLDDHGALTVVDVPWQE